VSVQPGQLVAALDLGSSKVTAVVAEVSGDARNPVAKILGVAVERSTGISTWRGAAPTGW
jgi:cell division ATPase FtsA